MLLFQGYILHDAGRDKMSDIGMKDLQRATLRKRNLESNLLLQDELART
jgi:hypothetical protein